MAKGKNIYCGFWESCVEYPTMCILCVRSPKKTDFYHKRKPINIMKIKEIK